MYIPSEGIDIRFDVQFEKYPEEVATIDVRLHSQGKQSVFKDPSVAATISFERERFVIKLCTTQAISILIRVDLVIVMEKYLMSSQKIMKINFLIP